MKRYNKAILITKETESKKLLEIQEFFKNHYKKELEIIDFGEEEIVFDEKAIYYLYLSDSDIKNFLKIYQEKQIILSILPNEKSPDAILRYGLSKDIYEAFDDSFDDSLRVNDQLLLCNGDVAFKKISIGNVHNLNSGLSKSSLYSNFKSFIATLRNLKYQKMVFKTAKEHTTQTVASGVLVLEDYTIYNTLKTGGKTSFHDGKLNAFIIAPFSLLSYVYHLLVVFFYHKFSLGKLPKDIGFISSNKLNISSQNPFDFTIDDALLSAKTIDLEVTQTNLKINYGKKFKTTLEEKIELDDKENINLKYLPKGEINNLLIAGKVPLIKKASDEDMKETLTSIKESSKVNSIFITLMILSTLLATVGIYQDSIPSVIGAMILAPLMAPIISLAMGATRSDNYIIKNSVVTLGFGILSALFFSAILTLFMPLDIVTTQISSRINPNLLDLFVAIFSGIAGAYASAKEEVAKSLAGVAIAVALVPPLAVTGIGIGWGDFDIIYGSFLLFLTNLFGMIVAASLTFVVLGFAPIRRAKKGLIYSILMLSAVSIPLVVSFYSLIQQSHDYSKLNETNRLTLNQKPIQLNVTNISSSTKETTSIEVEVISSSQLSDEELNELKEIIEAKIEKKISLQIVIKIIK